MKNHYLPAIILWIIAGPLAVAAQIKTEKKALPAELREQYIQKANQYRQQENYSAAATQLDTILEHNAADAGILLYKGDLKLQGKLYNDAVKTYKQLLPLNFEPTITKINLSYALFMNHKTTNALGYAKKAWEQNKTNSNAVVNYFNAMLWNIKTKEAGIFLKAQQSLLTPAQLLVLKARLFTTSGDYTRGLQYYDSLVRQYPDKYYIQEYAEVLLGKKEADASEGKMKANENLFSKNEYKAYREKLQTARLQNAGVELVFFKDVAGNSRTQQSAWWQQRDGRKYRFKVSAGSSQLSSGTGEKTNTQFACAGITERWNIKWSGQTDICLQLVNPLGGSSFAGFTGKQTVQYQPNDRRMVGLTYSTDLLNYTASLLGKNLRSNTLGYVTHILLTGKTGVYSQGGWSILNDRNQYLQFFGSLYHLFRTEPTLKAGFNFSAVHYTDTSIKTYFSPNKYFSTEVFADYSTALPQLSKFYWMVQGGAGLQKIENQNWDPAFRFQTELGFRLKHLESALKYQTSNVASSNGTGYRFNWFTFRVMWRW